MKTVITFYDLFLPFSCRVFTAKGLFNFTLSFMFEALIISCK